VYIPVINARKTGEVGLANSRKDLPIHDVEEIPEIDFSYAQKEGESEAVSLDHGWTSYSWLIWENRKLFWKVAVRALFVSSLIVILIPSEYASTAHIMPPDQGSGALLSLLAGRTGGVDGASPGLASLAGNVLGSASKGALFVDLAHSRTVQDHLVDRFNLEKVYRARYKQDARKSLEVHTSVEEDRKSGVLSITVVDVSPQRAQGMAQAYVEELDRLTSQVSTSAARRERIFIEQRLAAVKTDLEDAEQQFSAFASKKGTPDIKEQAKAMVEAAALLQGQVIATQSELQGLEQIYTPNNVRVRALRARLAELQSQLQKMGGTNAPLATDASAPEEMYPSIRQLPLLGVEWADRYRKMKIQETVYELLNQQYELTRIQEAKEIPTIRVIDPANLPEKKSWPPRLLIILLLTSFSLVVTAGCVVGSAYWQRVDPHNPGKVLVTRMWKAFSRDTRNLMERLPLGGIRSRLFSKPGAGTPES
jgi:capsule polysaccharide export protein KpsE/RkpR